MQANAQPILIPLIQTGVHTISNCPSDSVIASRARHIQNNKPFQCKVGDAIDGRYAEQPPAPFVERRIYDAFPNPGDTRLAAMFHKARWDSRRVILDKVVDERIRELGLRLLALGAHAQLSADEQVNFLLAEIPPAWASPRPIIPNNRKCGLRVRPVPRRCLPRLELPLEGDTFMVPVATDRRSHAAGSQLRIQEIENFYAPAIAPRSRNASNAAR